MLNIRLATNESYLDKDKVRRERTDWHTVVLFGRRAEALAKLLVKGSSIFVEGSIRTSSYEKDGVKKFKTEIHAQNIILAGGRRGGEQGGGQPQGGQGQDDFDQHGAAGGPGDDLPY